MNEEEPPRKRMVRTPTRGDDNARATPARLKTARGRTPSQQAWLERQINDPFAAEARARGYRSRAAFKLIELDDKLKLLKKGQRVLDLGCAPGGWLQVAKQRGVTQIVGVDLLDVEPISSIEILKMDFTDPACGPALIAALGGAPDLILSDIAPNTVGHRQTDHIRIVGLIEAAADFAFEVLKPGGAFVVKAFQGGETATILTLLKQRFDKVQHIKPKASRAESSEVYLAATGFRG
jgi:23S rRNA (uridine2552-2'-O)-methyltransferase